MLDDDGVANVCGFVGRFQPLHRRVENSVELETFFLRTVVRCYQLIGIISCIEPFLPIYRESLFGCTLDDEFICAGIDVFQLPALVQDVVRGPNRVVCGFLYIRFCRRVVDPYIAAGLSPGKIGDAAVKLACRFDAHSNEDFIRPDEGAGIDIRRQDRPLHQCAATVCQRSFYGCNANIVAGRGQSAERIRFSDSLIGGPGNRVIVAGPVIRPCHPVRDVEAGRLITEIPVIFLIVDAGWECHGDVDTIDVAAVRASCDSVPLFQRHVDTLVSYGIWEKRNRSLVICPGTCFNLAILKVFNRRVADTKVGDTVDWAIAAAVQRIEILCIIIDSVDVTHK